MYGYAEARKSYLADTVATASPGTLLVMLYDRLALDLERAEVALRSGERLAANAQLQHAQDIVTELQSTLDVSAWSGAAQLMSIYTYLASELMGANIEANADRVAVCRGLVDPLREAWREVVTNSSRAAIEHVSLSGVA